MKDVGSEDYHYVSRWSHIITAQASAAVAHSGNIIVPYVGGGVDGVRALDPEGTVLWTADLGAASGGVAIAPDDTIYASASQSVHAIDEDGSILWSTDLDDYVIDGLVLDGGGTVYARSSTKVMALNASDGSLKWSLNVGVAGSPNGAPLIGPDGTMYVGNVNGHLYAYACVPEPSCIWLLASAAASALLWRRTRR